MKQVKKSDLKQLVTETLHRELKKRQLLKKLNEINSQLQEMQTSDPDYVDDEFEAHTGESYRSGIVKPENYKAYSLEYDSNDYEHDYFQIGVDYNGKVSGSHSQATLEEPAEYPEIEVQYERWYVMNQETGDWEDLTDDHVVLKADSGLKERFHDNNIKTLEAKVADGDGPGAEHSASVHKKYNNNIGKWIK